MIDVYMEQFDHPYLFTLVPVAAVFFGLAVVASSMGANLAAGFLTLYSAVALIICFFGYAALGAFAYSTEALRQWRIKRRSAN